MLSRGVQSPEKLLRKREVAERLACSLRTVEREASVGRLTRIKVRGGVRFLESEVQKLISGEL
jgi:excisionase family DNA binding protein